jgi:hypothetical protein
MDSMRKWLEGYERSKRLREPNPDWVSTRFDLQNTPWQELQKIYLPEVKMCLGPACSALKRNWLKYKITSGNGVDSRRDIAWTINKLQAAIGLELSQFEELAEQGIFYNEDEEDQQEDEMFQCFRSLLDALKDETEEKELQKEEEIENDDWWIS